MTEVARERSKHVRSIAFGVLLVLYAALTLSILYRTPVLSLDTWVRHLGAEVRAALPASAKPWISTYVAFGQRGPSTLVFLPVFLWMAWRRRTAQPLVRLGVALVLLNVSVGVVKILTGRLGPLRTHNTHAVFVGGNIFPSGHVSNTVMLYGLIAMLSVHHRRILTAAAIWLSITVGMGTVYLKTHWFSDIVGGWLAGGLILLALPWVSPYAERAVDSLVSKVRARRSAPVTPAVAVRPPAARPVAPVGGRPARPAVAVRAHRPAARTAGATTTVSATTAVRSVLGSWQARVVEVLAPQDQRTPVSSSARAHSAPARSRSFEDDVDPTR